MKNFEIILIDDVNHSKLLFKLKCLEKKLSSLVLEKNGIEKRLFFFNKKYNENLGEIIKELLDKEVQYRKLLEQLEQDQTKKEKLRFNTRSAEENYKKYSEEYDVESHKKNTMLDNNSKEEMKRLYRKARGYCHPDKLQNNLDKEKAHMIFIELQKAYEDNDIELVRIIANNLQKGCFQFLFSIKNNIERVKSHIVKVKLNIKKIIDEIHILVNSDAHLLLNDAGIDESVWELFFEKQKIIYLTEIASLNNKILVLRRKFECL